MSRSILKIATMASALTILSACSGGGGGGSGGSTLKASGALSVPNINCGGSSCFAGVSKSTRSMNSGEELAAYGEDVYSYFNQKTLPKINEQLYMIENTFKSEGLESCSDIVSAPNGTYPLEGSYTVDIYGSTTTSPFGGNISKGFIVKYQNTPVIELGVGCDNTVRHFYARVIADTQTRYEVWAKTDSASPHAKSILAAGDYGDTRLTLRFVGTTADSFVLSAIGKSYPNPYVAGQTVDFAIHGQAILSQDRVKIAYTNVAADVPPTAYSPVNPTWMGAAIQHCYSPFSSWTIDSDGSDCSSLNEASPTISGVRGLSGATWTIDNFDATIPGIVQ